MNGSRRHSGMALVLVLMVSSLLLISGLMIWSALQTDIAQISVSIPRIQAEFLAKGALQLGLFKARCCPTPLYDAVSYSVGKNPYYVHSHGYGRLSDIAPATLDPEVLTFPGPAFLTGDVTIDNATGQLTSRTNVKTIPGAPSSTDGDDLNPQDGLVNSDYKVDRYLNFFVLDLADRTVASPVLAGPPAVSVSGQSSVSVSETVDCPIMGGKDPYSGSLRIRAINILGGPRQYGTDSVQLVAEASVSTRISGKDQNWTVQAITIYRTRRRYD
jgi:hypothetical protein